MRKKKLGFTLIEVMVTIVILGILIVPLTRLIIFSVWGTKQTKDFVIAFTGEYVRLGGINNIVASFSELVSKIPNLKLLEIQEKKNVKF